MTTDFAEAPLRPVGGRLTLVPYLRSMWRRREFLLALTSSRLRARTSAATLGGVWNVLEPLLLAGVYYLIFGVVVDGRSGIDNYAAFLVLGLFTFYYTQKSVLDGARVIASNERLLRSIHVPRGLLPLSSVLAQATLHLPAVAVMLTLVLITGERPHLTWLLLLPIIALQTVFNLGLVFAAARLTYEIPDVERVLPYVLRIWLYFSVLLYSVELLPEEPGWIRNVFVANPMYPFIQLTRRVALDGQLGEAMWWSAAGWSLLALVLGFFLFSRREQAYGYRYR